MDSSSTRVGHLSWREPLLRSLLSRVVFGGLLIGALYGGIRYGSPATGGMAGASMSSGFFTLERFVLRRNAGGLIRPLPFLAYFALRSILYVGVIVLATVVVTELMVGRFGGIGGADLLFSLSLVVGANLLFSVNDLLGPGVLFAFAAGRYYEPRIEGAGAPVHRHALLDRDRRTTGRTQLSEVPQPLHRRRVARHRRGRRRNPQICRRRDHRDLAARSRA